MVLLLFSQVSILERRNTAGKVVFKTLGDPWTGSESDKFVLLGYLDQLRKDPAFLSSEAVLPDLADELAPVSITVGKDGPSGGAGWTEQGSKEALLGSVGPPSRLSPDHCPFPLWQVFLLRWLYSASDSLSDWWESLLHSNW